MMILREALQAVYDRHGELTPELVVDTAKKGDDEVAERLRQSLPWDAERALTELQLLQAERLIRSVKIRVLPGEPRDPLHETRTRYFLNINAPEGRAYHPTAVVAANPVMARLALQDAERDWKALKRKYADLDGFFDMVRGDLDREGVAEAA